jgi:alkylation response protein AidB-like acyl-CoA dehydrogenase
MLGLAEGAHRLAVDYARRRRAFGQAILEFQAVSFPLAQIAAEIIAVDLVIKEALRVLETARSHLQAMNMANSAKLLAAQLAERAASTAVETLGGNGVAEEFAVEKLYRDAKVGKIYEGTENILLRDLSNTLIGESL